MTAAASAPDGSSPRTTSADLVAPDGSPRWTAPAETATSVWAELSPSRRSLILVALLAMLGLFGGVLSWYRPIPSPYFVPLWVTQYRSSLIRTTPWSEGDREALRLAPVFPRTAEAYSSQESLLLWRELTHLSRVPASENLVVYLSAYAVSSRTGEIMVVPADGDPQEGHNLLALRDVLRWVKASPARAKLLVLDVMSSPEGPFVSDIFRDIPARIPQLVREVEQEAVRTTGFDRKDWLVLCPCSPGQVPHQIELLGRTVFGFYFEQGLRGEALGYSLRHYDHNRRVSVLELSDYLQATVDRWAQRVLNVRQTPMLLGDGPDFDLYSVSRSRSGEPEELGAFVYSPPLIQGWNTLQTWRQDGTLRLLPRLARRLEAALLNGEHLWISGARGSLAERLAQERLQQLLTQADQARTSLVIPQRAASLAWSEAITSQTLDRAVVQSLSEAVAAWKLLPSDLKPADREAALKKIYESVLKSLAGKSAFAVESAIWDLAQSGETLRTLLPFLDRLLTERGQPVEYLETMFLRRLAGIAVRVGETQWSEELARTAVQAVGQAEQVAATPLLTFWCPQVLNDCVQARWEGEILLNHYDVVSPQDILARFREANRWASALLMFAHTIQQARENCDESLLTLHPDAIYLELDPIREANWLDRLRATENLLPLLEPPANVAQLPLTDLQPLASRVRRASDQLRSELNLFQVTARVEGISQALTLASRAEATAAAVEPLDRGLRLPLLPWDDRKKLLTTRHDLLVRLHQATRQMDRSESRNSGRFPVGRLSDAERNSLRQAEFQRAKLRTRCQLQLLRLAGLPSDDLEELNTLAQQCYLSADVPQWFELTARLRLCWTRTLTDVVNRADPQTLDRLMFLYPPGLVNERLDLDGGPRVARWSQIRRQHLAWLAQSYRYALQQGLSAELLENAINGVDPLGQGLHIPPLEVLGPTTTVKLSATGGIGTAELKVLLRLPDQTPTVEFLVAEQAGFRVQADTSQFQFRVDPITGFRLGTLPIQVIAQTDARQPLAAGFVVAFRLAGRRYFVRVPVEATRSETPVELIFAPTPTDPIGLGNDIRLRPSETPQPLFILLRSRSDKPKTCIVRLMNGEQLLPNGEAKVVLAPGVLTPVRFPSAGPMTSPMSAAKATNPGNTTMPSPSANATAPTHTPPDPPGVPLDLPNALRVDVFDETQPGTPIVRRPLQITLADPTEFVELVDATFLPVHPPLRQWNRLEVQLRQRRSLGQVPCSVELVLDPNEVPGLGGIKAGRLRGTVPTDGTAVRLDAEGLALDVATPSTGHANITIDGVERAIRLRIDFARFGEATTPILDSSTRLHLHLLPAPVPGQSVVFSAGADQAPDGSTLVVQLLRPLSVVGGKSATEVDLEQRFPGPRHREVWLYPAGPQGELQLTPRLRDWIGTWKTPQWVGPRTVRLRLLDRQGRLLQELSQGVTLDATAPQGVTFRNVPPQVLKGKPVRLQAVGSDAESDIREVAFFWGKPTPEGKVPPNVDLVIGQRSDADPEVWEVDLPLPPEKTGTTDVSVRFTNGVGLTQFASTSIEVTEKLPPSPGMIQGEVRENDRPQGDLEVRLLNAKNEVIRRTRTDAAGQYRFDSVDPGKYTIISSKTGSNRVGRASVTLAPTQTVTANLSLVLPGR